MSPKLGDTKGGDIHPCGHLLQFPRPTELFEGAHGDCGARLTLSLSWELRRMRATRMLAVVATSGMVSRKCWRKARPFLLGGGWRMEDGALGTKAPRSYCRGKDYCREHPPKTAMGWVSHSKSCNGTSSQNSKGTGGNILWHREGADGNISAWQRRWMGTSPV